MVQPCPECRQTRRHKLSCGVPARARYIHTRDPLHGRDDAPDLTPHFSDADDTRCNDSDTGDTDTCGSE